MTKTRTLSSFFIIVSLLLWLHVSQYALRSSEPVKTQIVIILDASGSMWGKIAGDTKIKIAKDALLEIVEDLKDKPVHIALRIYGHKNKKCSNTELEIPMGPVDIDKIKKTIIPIKPKGKTPISLSLIKSVDDFVQGADGEKVVILVTDGIETCRGNPCEVAESLKKGGVVTKIHIVGFGMKAPDLAALKCVVKPSGGIVVRADSREELKESLSDLIEESVEKNLIVTAKDKTGKTVFISVAILEKGMDIQNSDGNDVGFYVNPGTYSIIVTNPATNEKRTIKDAVITGSALQRYSVTFGVSDLLIKGSDSSGKTIDTIMVIYDAETSKIKHILERNKDHRISLEKGVYDIEIQDIDTNEKQWVRALVMGTEDIEKTVIFKRGYLRIETKNHKGLDIKTNVDVYKKGEKVPLMSSPGKIIHDFILPEGTFDVSIRYWYSQAGASLDNIVISDESRVEKDIVINTAE